MEKVTESHDVFESPSVQDVIGRLMTGCRPISTLQC